MKKKLAVMVTAFICGALAMSTAMAKPEFGKAWKVKCNDGMMSESLVSLGHAICGCNGRGGSIEYPKFACRGKSPASQTFGQPVKIRDVKPGVSKQQ